LPFGSGKQLGASLPRPARWAASGWQVSTLVRLQKGMPMSFPSDAAPTGLNPALPSPSYTEWFNTCTQLTGNATQNCNPGEQPAAGLDDPPGQHVANVVVAAGRRPPSRSL
jgi:hypothetical protein